jgi:protein-S-isoprenylcysteine O-methyltransferase Ste14
MGLCLNKAFFLTKGTIVIKFGYKAKLYDLVTVIPVIIWLGAGIAGSTLRASQILDSRGSTLAISAQAATVLFLSLAIVFLVIRRPPIRKARGALPRIAAFVSCLLPFSLFVLAPAKITAAASFLSSALVFFGTMAAIISIFWLGRSFSIFPQARGLVVDGPYRLIRHPLYFAELCVMSGRMLEFQQPWGSIVLFVAIGVLIARMHFEEKLLLETFPSYRDYMSRTARLIPGFY